MQWIATYSLLTSSMSCKPRGSTLQNTTPRARLQFSKWHPFHSITDPALRTRGAILEIGLRVSVIPLNVTPQPVLLTLFLGFYSQRVQKPLQRTSTAVFCTKLHLMHRHRHSADQRVKQHCYQLVYRQRVDLRVKCYCTLLRVIMRDERLVVMTCTSELPGNQGFNLLRVKCN